MLEILELFSFRELSLGFLALLAVVVLAVYFVVNFAGSSEAKAKAINRLDEMGREAKLFLQRAAERKKLPVIPVDIVLKEDEVGIFQESSKLYETRAYRVYGGGGTRIKGIYIGGGASESHQRLREIDSGTVVLTNLRIVFDGHAENRTVNLKDVISAKPWTDAVEVSSGRRQKSQIYTVGNPFIWAPVIQMLAKGQISIDDGGVVRVIG